MRKELFYYIFLAMFSITGTYYFLSTPISAGDTDMWYHLNGGRFFFDNGTISDSTFFSFIDPARYWNNYYWLFQVMLYKAYFLGGYVGIIIYRTIAFLLAMGFVYIFLFTKNNNGTGNFSKTPFLAFIFVSIFLLFINRFIIVRPHTITYIFIPLFIYILECKKKWVYILPIIAIFWSNFHGIEYPVMIVLISSYLAEAYYNRFKKREPFNKQELIYVLFLSITMFMVLATPHGYKLVQIPFKTTQYVSLFVSEIRILDLKDYLYYNFSPHEFTTMSFFSIFAALGGLAFVKAIFTKNIKLSHALMFLAAIFLIIKGLRFVYEFSLLILPMIKHNLISSPANDSSGKNKLTSPVIAFSILLIFLSFFYLRESFLSHQGKYPLSNKNIPVGIASFLKNIEATGTVMNHANYGGYFQWELFPHYKIFMDMEIPFLFKDEDFFFLSHAYTDKEVFRKFYYKYKPDFISVPAVITKFKKVIADYPNYKPVFFDDLDILYVNSDTYPEIAKRFTIKLIDPFNIFGANINNMGSKTKQKVLDELTRLYNAYPKNSIVNQIMAIIYTSQKEYIKSATHAKVVIEESPSSPIGYGLLADSLMGNKKYSDAVVAIKEALERSNKDELQSLYKKLWFANLKLNKDKDAYMALKKGVNIFESKTSYRDIYNLGLLALKLERPKEAIDYLKFAYIKTPSSDVKTKTLIKEKLIMIDKI